MIRYPLLLLAAIACAVWAVIVLGPAPDWPGNPLQLVAAALAFFFLAALPWVGWRVDWRDRGDAGAVNPSALWGREPVMTLAVAQAVVACLIGFGAPITLAQGGLIMGVVAALVGWLARSQVTPTSS